MGIFYFTFTIIIIVKRSGNVKISYSPFYDTLKKKGITQYVLIEKYNISRGMLDSLRHNRSVTMTTILDLCEILDCDVQDIVKIEK